MLNLVCFSVDGYDHFFAKSNSPQRMFSAPTRPRTPRKSGFKNILTEVSMVYAEKTATNMPTTKIIKEKNLPTVPATLKTSNASVPVVSLKIGARLGI